MSASTPMIGRDQELAAARRLLSAAGNGTGGLLIVTGEAGIGKSRLLAELAHTARETGSTVLIGRSFPGGGTFRALAAAVATPLRGLSAAETDRLRPFRAAFARLAPAWPDESATSTGDGAPDPIVMLAEGLLQLLSGPDRAAGSVLILEDVHWADADTLAVLAYLAGAAQGSPVLVAVSARDDQPAPAAASASGVVTIADLVSMSGVSTIRLGRLDDAAVAAIASASAGGDPVNRQVLTTLVEKADGLPVVIDELLIALLDAARVGGAGGEPVLVPGALQGLVQGRISGLDDNARTVAQAAAVLGPEPDWTLLPAITRLPEAVVHPALRTVANAGLFVTDGGQLRWRHALTRDAVLATMLPPERAGIARRAAGEIASRCRPQDAALEADLLTAAGETADAAAVLLRQARQDMARGALRSAAELIDRARATDTLAGQVAIHRVQLLTLQGREQQALQDGVRTLSATVGDEHAELSLALARAAVSYGRWQSAREFVERAGRPEDPRSSTLLAEAAFGSGDLERAADLGGVAVGLAERADRPDALCEALIIVGRCASMTNRERSTTAYRRAAQVAAEHGLRPWRFEALFGLGLGELTGTDDPTLLLQARDLALDIGQIGRALSIELILNERPLLDSGPLAAEATSMSIADRAGQLGLTGLRALAEAAAAAGRAQAGDVAGMTDLLTQAVAQPGASLEVAAFDTAVRAIVPWLMHDLVTADRLLDNAFRPLAEHASAAPIFYWGAWVVLRAAVAGDSGPTEFLRTAPAGLRDVNRGAVHYADAITAGRAGQSDLAATSLTAGDRALGRHNWWRRLLRLVALEAAVVDGWGDPVAALRADLTVFEHDGEQLLARTCRDLLRQAGAPTRRGRGDAQVPPNLRALGVTSREMDVLGLVADGLTNAEIAGRLFLSPRTIETHVASLLAKTANADRAGLRTTFRAGSQQ